MNRNRERYCCVGDVPADLVGGQMIWTGVAIGIILKAYRLAGGAVIFILLCLYMHALGANVGLLGKG